MDHDLHVPPFQDLAGAVLATIHMPPIMQRIENVLFGVCHGTVDLVLSVRGEERFRVV
jgi:hypothetical protein